MIPLFGSKTGDEEISQVSESIKNQWMGKGKKVEEFESRMKEKLKTENFIMVDSGSNALYLALKLLDLPQQSEVILPSLTWVACAQSVLLLGHKPVFCDIDYNTGNVTAETISTHINKNTKAIMVVHFAGKSVDLDPIISLASEKGIKVIEDAAHAIDSTYKEQACGTIGDIGIYSFDAVKNLAMPEGGGITCKNPELIKKAEHLRYSGIGPSGFESLNGRAEKWWEYNISEPFIKMMPNDISAGIGLAQLEKLEKHQEKRKQIWQTYQSAFKDLSWIETPENSKDNEKHSYFTYQIKVPKRDQLAKYLKEKGIYSKLVYHPLHLNQIYNSNANLPNSEKINEKGLNIPLHPGLSSEDVEKIISEILQFGKEQGL